MNAFVTGGTGFIGTRVLELLRVLGVRCRALVRRQEDAARIERLGAVPVPGDLTVRESLLEGMRGCDTVINIAGLYSFWLPDPTAYRRVNVEGTRHVMEAALEVGARKVVHVSTAVTFGKPAMLPFTEDSEPGPERFSEYARTKYEGDLLAWRAHRENGLPLVVVYPVGVLGAGDPKATGQYVSNLVNGRLPAVVFVDSPFTWVHVKDVAEVIVRAADRDGNVGEKYLAGKERATFGQLNRMIAEVAGVRLPRMRLPDPLAMANGRLATLVANMTKRPPIWGMAIDQFRTMREGVICDGRKAERELGVRYTPLRIAIEEEVASVRGQGKGTAQAISGSPA